MDDYDGYSDDFEEDCESPLEVSRPDHQSITSPSASLPGHGLLERNSPYVTPEQVLKSKIKAKRNKRKGSCTHQTPHHNNEELSLFSSSLGMASLLELISDTAGQLNMAYILPSC